VPASKIKQFHHQKNTQTTLSTSSNPHQVKSRKKK